MKSHKPRPRLTLTLDKIVGGGQTLGTLEDGKKAFVWGGLPGETVEIEVTKSKHSFAEGIVTQVIEPSDKRIEAKDPDSYLSTSPWQIMSFEDEQATKQALILEAFELSDVTLPHVPVVRTDGTTYGYRNKVEYSFWWDTEAERLDLAFFRRGSHGKIPVQGTSLARPEIDAAAHRILELLRTSSISGRDLKTLMLRSTRDGLVAAQLYVKEKSIERQFSDDSLHALNLLSFELIFSNPKSPASVITERLLEMGSEQLDDPILGTDFSYACEGFFQVNVPMYELALEDMRGYLDPSQPTLDMYSGVGTIGLTIGGDAPTLVEINASAVGEMRRNAAAIGSRATIVHASSETALEHIVPGTQVVLDPPRAGLHADVTDRLLEVQPPRIVYLSCNPTTQARDVARLLGSYEITEVIGYNFFPRTPHIENLVVLTLKKDEKHIQ